MEQHAVPQDITGFKFKLVGDMTLVQFGELAGGLIVGWIIWSSPLHVILRAPFAAFFALLGVGLAFVPIEERPMHVWIFNFFKAIYHPTYYIWKRASGNSISSPPTVSKVAAEANALPINSTPLLPIEQELPKTSGPWPYASSVSPNLPATPPSSIAAEMSPALAPEAPPSTTQANSNASPRPAPAEEGTNKDSQPMSIEELLNVREQKATEVNQPTAASSQGPMTVEELEKRRQQLSMAADAKGAIALSEAERKVNKLTDQNKELLMQIDEIRNKLYTQQPGADLSGMTKDLDGLMEKKNKLAGEIATVRDELAGVRVAPLLNPSYQHEPAVKKPSKPPAPAPKQAIISLTAIPNVVNGLVLDSQGKPLEGAIVIVKDENINSIRALRTNKVGQFIASTPLSNGNYTIEVEKNNYSFGQTPMALTGQVLDPLEIRAWAEDEAQAQTQS